jgi:hypothetical protein
MQVEQKKKYLDELAAAAARAGGAKGGSAGPFACQKVAPHPPHGMLIHFL